MWFVGFCITLTPPFTLVRFRFNLHNFCYSFAYRLYNSGVFEVENWNYYPYTKKKSGSDPSNCENYRTTDLVKVDFVPISKTSVSSLLSFRKLAESQSFISAKQMVKKEKKNKTCWKIGRAGCRRHSRENRWHIFWKYGQEEVNRW